MQKYIPSFNESTEPEQMSWYVGVADCLGLDSFAKLNEEADFKNADSLQELGLWVTGGKELEKETREMLQFMTARTRANLHRHAVMYKAKLSDEAAFHVEWTFRREGSEKGLIALKKHAHTIQLARGGGVDPVKLWKKIPNPSLDPTRA